MQYQFGVVLGSFEGWYHLTLLRSLDRAARILGVRLFCFRSHADLAAVQNIALHGLLIEAAPDYLTENNYSILRAGFPGLPLVCLGAPFKDAVWIGVGNYQASHRLASHLIRDHGHRRIAYIYGRRGQPEAEERFRAYVDALGENSIGIDQNLIVDGDFTVESGRLAVMSLLDDRKSEFTALMAGSDLIALGAATELRRRGFRIPLDVAITGFDDIDEAAFGGLQLTTAHLPLPELVFTGIQALIALNEGEVVQPEFILNSQTRFRFSCGCGVPAEESRLASTASATGLQILSWIDIILRPNVSRIESVFEVFRASCQECLDFTGDQSIAWPETVLADSLARVFNEGRPGIDTLRKIQHHIQVFLQNLPGHDQEPQWQNLARLLRTIHFLVSSELSRMTESERLEFYGYLRFEMAAADSLSGLQFSRELPGALQQLFARSEYEWNWLLSARTGELLAAYSRNSGTDQPGGLLVQVLHADLPVGLYLGLSLRHESSFFGYWFFSWKDMRFARFDNIAIQITNAWRVLEANDEVELTNAAQRETVNRINGINLELEASLGRLHARQQQLLEVRKLKDLNATILGISVKVDGLLRKASESSRHFGESRAELTAAFQTNTLTQSGTVQSMAGISGAANQVMQDIGEATGYIDRLRAMAGSQGTAETSNFELMAFLRGILDANLFLLEDGGHRFQFQPPDGVEISMRSWQDVLAKALGLILAFLVKEVLAGSHQASVMIQAESANKTVRITVGAQGRSIQMDRISLGGLYEMVTRRLGGNLSFGWNADSGTRFVLVLPRWLEGSANA